MEFFGSILNRLLKMNPSLAEGLEEARILGLWAEVVGPAIAKRSRATELRGKKIVVEVDHPVWKQQLLTNKNVVLKKYEDVLGRPLITDLILKNSSPQKS